MTIKNSVVKELTGGSTIKARNNLSNDTLVKLFLKLVLECNVIPLYHEDPQNADKERLLVIKFISSFLDDPEKWDETHYTAYKNNPEAYIEKYGSEYTPRHNYPCNPKYMNVEWQIEYRNIFLNILIEHLQELIDENFEIAKFVPESVKQDSLQTIQNSCDISNIFEIYYEKCSNDLPVSKYPTIASIAQQIRSSKEYNFDYSKHDKNFKKTWTSQRIKEFFNENELYSKQIRHNLANKTTYLLGWKLKSNEFSHQLNSLDDNDII
jgi:hypothetical protein